MNEKSSTPLSDRQLEALASLSPRECECLRLSVQGYYQTKEIAQRLAISEDRVNKLVQSIRKKLGTSSRGEAIRQFIKWDALQSDGRHPTHFMGSQIMGLQELAVLEFSELVDDSAVAPDTTGDASVAAPEFATGNGTTPSLIDLAPLRNSGRQANDLSINHMVIAIAVIAVGVLVAVGSAVSLLTGMNSLFSH
ncbi:LuxR C-terminal-related transcriptional regulator [Novosphingobium sediminicola]|uniref:DNA-binding CsgD family transcriptional regulator n=1 Tax=Novosphingobium sediminicola TaxID=563162 RepID=A0A7W6CQ13_9SPHN|nr:DNA-binding CsgD family transcriptional regulator [Novosphingobium sediminicola]